MKKRIIKILVLAVFTVLLNVMLITKANAANASVSISSNKSTVVVGNNVTFNVAIQSGTPLGVWDYATSVSSNLVYVSGNKVSLTGILAPNQNTKYVTYSFTYRAKSSGTATFNFKLNNIYDVNEGSMGISGSTSKSVKIISQAELEASYSKNNNLSGLSVEGYQLSPTFNKNTLEYEVELPNGVTKIKINASKEDGTASIQGTGEREVSEGKNKLEIKVTAQNGSVKTYVINATVKELDPIIVKVNNKDYNVVRKKSQITAPNSTFIEKEIKIDDLEVPAFENEKLGYTLVGLKDSDGNIDLYIYDEKENSYTIYKEYTFKSLIICVIDDDSKIPEGYTKTNIKIDDKEIDAYQLTSDSKYYLFYGINVETGKENLYVYDKEEETIQRYNDDEAIDDAMAKEEIYQYIIIGLGSLLIITYLVLLINLISNSKKKKKMKMKKMSKKKEKVHSDKEINIEEDNNKDEKES